MFFILKKNQKLNAYFCSLWLQDEEQEKAIWEKGWKAALGWVWGSEGGIPAQQKMESMAKQSVLLWKERGGEPSELGRGRAGVRAVWGEQHKQWDGGTG